MHAPNFAPPDPPNPEKIVISTEAAVALAFAVAFLVVIP
jgi:hypothetical protein